MTETILVLIDTKDVTYARYAGKRRTHKFDTESLLTPFWIEEIRNDPDQFEATPDAPIQAA